MKVTQQEIVEALRGPIGAVGNAKRKELANRIDQHGIAPPDGMVLVPKELTTEMLLARNSDSWPSLLSDEAEALWDAFISAAPEVKPQSVRHVRYVPMTDDELQDVWIKSGDLNGTETMRMMESAVIRRAGLEVVCKQTEKQE